MIPSIRRYIHVLRDEGPLAGLELAMLRFGSALLGQDRAYFGLIKMTDRWYDWRTGLDTGGAASHAEIEIDPQTGRDYLATTPRAWSGLMRHLPIEPQKFTYIDLGCGKGRTLVLAANWGFRRVIGVDLSEPMAAAAESNVAKSGAAGVEIVRGNAGEYQFPDGPLVLFLYNPFWSKVNECVAGNLHVSVTRKPREVYVVYWRPLLKEIWDKTASLELYKQCDALYPWYAIYRSRS
ncbi:MAG: class I SAM-dependent methyltransferase [Terriglobia bacterium]